MKVRQMASQCCSWVPDPKLVRVKCPEYRKWCTGYNNETNQVGACVMNSGRKAPKPTAPNARGKGSRGGKGTGTKRTVDTGRQDTLGRAVKESEKSLAGKTNADRKAGQVGGMGSAPTGGPHTPATRSTNHSSKPGPGNMPGRTSTRRPVPKPVDSTGRPNPRGVHRSMADDKAFYGDRVSKTEQEYYSIQQRFYRDFDELAKHDRSAAIIRDTPGLLRSMVVGVKQRCFPYDRDQRKPVFSGHNSLSSHGGLRSYDKMELVDDPDNPGRRIQTFSPHWEQHLQNRRRILAGQLKSTKFVITDLNEKTGTITATEIRPEGDEYTPGQLILGDKDGGAPNRSSSALEGYIADGLTMGGVDFDVDAGLVLEELTMKNDKGGWRSGDKIRNYRISPDMVIRGKNGKILVLELDGGGHHMCNQADDVERTMRCNDLPNVAGVVRARFGQSMKTRFLDGKSPGYTDIDIPGADNVHAPRNIGPQETVEWARDVLAPHIRQVMEANGMV